MQRADLEVVLGWRNHPDVRQCMFSYDEISVEEHLAWFERASVDPCKHLLVLEADESLVGFVSFSEISEGKVSEWSFHAAPDAVKGSGTVLCSMALDYAFNVLCMHKVCGQVLDCNARSIRLHQRLGFRQEGLLSEQFYREGRYYDVLFFGVTINEWLASR